VEGSPGYSSVCAAGADPALLIPLIPEAQRGRRGLDILKKLQKQTSIEVKIVEQDFPKIKEVDAKLVALAKQMNARVITNDFNLNKVAEKSRG